MSSRGSLSHRAAPLAAPASALDLVDKEYTDLRERTANKDQPNGYAGLDAAGRITVPDIPAVIAQARAVNASGTNQTIANAWTAVDLAAEDFDDDNVHSTATNTGRFTYTRAGIYRITALVLWMTGTATSSNTLRQARLVKDGTLVPASLSSGVYSGGYYQLVIPSVLVSVAAGQYVELQAFSQLASGASLYRASDGSGGSIMTSELVRTA